MRQPRKRLVLGIAFTAAFAASADGDILALDAVLGTGAAASSWVAGGATLGDDASAPGGTASYYTGKSPNRRLFVPIADAAIPGSPEIHSVKVRVLARSVVDLSGTYDGIKVALWVNGAQYLDPAIDEQGTEYLYYEHTWQLNPATGVAWTWADINALEAGCITAKTAQSQTTTYYVDHVQVVVEHSEGANTPPIASGVRVSGADTVVGGVLTGSYTYTDAEYDSEGQTRFAWYRADDTLGTNKAAISGATGTTCIIPVVAEGRYIFFEVTPVARTGITEGLAVESRAFGPIAPASGSAPTAADVAISGQARLGETLTGTYTYGDADGDLEGATLVRWLRDSAPIAGAVSATYVLVAADIGAMIRFEVTPLALTGTPKTGAAAASAAVGPVEGPVSVALPRVGAVGQATGPALVVDLRGAVVARGECLQPLGSHSRAHVTQGANRQAPGARVLLKR